MDLNENSKPRPELTAEEWRHASGVGRIGLTGMHGGIQGEPSIHCLFCGFVAPAPTINRDASEWKCLHCRDQFAMAALTGICAHPDMTPTESRELAECAYDHADAMLEARKRVQGKSE